MRLLALLLTVAAGSSATAQQFVEAHTYTVAPGNADAFIRHDAELRTPPLATRPGYLKKEVWQSAAEPTKLEVVIHWRSAADRDAVPADLLAATDRRFAEAMGGAGEFTLTASRTYTVHPGGLPAPATPALEPPTNPTLELASLDLTPHRETTVTIPHDAVYRSKKTYRAVPLVDILDDWLPTLSPRPDPDAHEIIFECADGYAPARPLSQALSGHAHVAFADTAAPAGQTWTAKKKFDGSPLVLAPFYLVWDDADNKVAASRPWPHNLVRIRIVPADARYAALEPADAKHAAGFRLFRTHCIVCHPLAGTGGTMGPDLLAPKNITTYWQQEHLLPYLKNPAAYRQNAKMPPMRHVGDSGLNKVLDYLRSLLPPTP